VEELQAFLNTHGFIIASSGPGSPGNETSYFGFATKTALIRFQNAYASSILTPEGLAYGNGVLGPATKAEIESLLFGPPIAASSTPPVSPSPVFTRSLSLGSSGPDVRKLQAFLNAHGFTVAVSGPGSSGNETSYFGLATQAALIQFQKKNGLPATGLFGPMTMEVVN
jgi:hypothetical protein